MMNLPGETNTSTMILAITENSTRADLVVHEDGAKFLDHSKLRYK
jgi:hypothetical protein